MAETQCESAWDAIVDGNALDIEEEERFEQFVRSKGATRYSPAEVIEEMFVDWEIFERNVETLELEYRGYKLLLKRVGDNADCFVYEGDELRDSLMGFAGFVPAEHAAHKKIDDWLRNE